MAIQTYYDDILMSYVAYDDANYCGCPDCHDHLGFGDTRQDAIDDLQDILDSTPDRG